MARIVEKNLHVPLNEELHRRLHAESKRSLRPATDLVREAIELWLREQERTALHDQIASYAREHAGSRDDLDPVMEEAALEHLTTLERKRK